jgi:hypothetical protein
MANAMLRSEHRLRLAERIRIVPFATSDLTTATRLRVLIHKYRELGWARLGRRQIFAAQS